VGHHDEVSHVQEIPTQVDDGDECVGH